MRISMAVNMRLVLIKLFRPEHQKLQNIISEKNNLQLTSSEKREFIGVDFSEILLRCNKFKSQVVLCYDLRIQILIIVSFVGRFLRKRLN